MTRNEFIRENAQNFIYCFIPAASINNFPVAIRKKRADQLTYIANMANSTSIIAEMDARLIEQYGMGGYEILQRMCAGYNITGNATLAGIGSVPYDPVEIDPRTGFPLSMFAEEISEISGVGTAVTALDSNAALTKSLQTKPVTIELTSGEILSSVFNNETKQPVGVYNATTGRQISKYDTTTNTFKATTSTNADGGNFWSWVLKAFPFIISLCEWIGQLFGVKKSTEVTSLQSDGWYSAGTTNTANMGLLPIFLVGGVLMYGIANNKQTGVKNKKKSN